MTNDSIFARVGQNLSVLGLAQLFTWVSSFLLLLFLPKYLGSKEFGLLFVALSVREILSMVIDFGGSHRIPKEIARDPVRNRSVLAQYVMLRVLIWLMITIILLSAGFTLGIAQELMPLIAIFLMANLFEGISKTYRAFYQGIEQMKIPSISLIVEKVFVSAFSIGFLISGADARIIALIFTAGTLLNLMFLWTMSRKDLSISFSWDPALLSSIRLAMPYFLWSLFSMIYFRIDALMLHSIVPQDVTGWYGAAYRFFDAVMILPALLKVALFPVFSRLATDSATRLEEVFEKSVRFTLLLAIPISLGIYLSATWIIDLFMGLDEYAPSVFILKIFCIGIPLMFADFILGSLLIGSVNRQSIWAGVGFVAIILNVSLNMWLIPLFQQKMGNGGAGAAISTVITECFILGSALFLVPGVYFRKFKPGVYARMALIVSLMMGLLWVMQMLGIHWAIQILLVTALFGLATWMFPFISDYEKHQFITMLNRMRSVGESPSAISLSAKGDVK